jgi:hypothetical protein
MLTKNFWSLLCGGGDPITDSSNSNMTYVAGLYINEKLSRVRVNNLAHAHQIIRGNTTLTSNPIQILSNASYDKLSLFYNEKAISDMTEAEIYKAYDRLSTRTDWFRIPSLDYEGQYTGVKAVSTFLNNTSSPLTYNKFSWVNTVNSNGNIILTIEELPEAITIQPAETYSIEYKIDNIFTTMPETVS